MIFMEEYASNSYKSKQPPAVQNTQEEKKVESVVSSPVKKQKVSRFQKFANAVVQDDVKSIRSYIFEDIMVPAAKRFIHDSVDAILYPGGGSKRESSRPQVSYRRYYDDRDRDDRRPYRSERRSVGYSFDNYNIPNRGEAEEVITELRRIARRYDGIASVADYYDLLGVNDSNYTNNRYGWTEHEINEAYVKPAREGGYYIVLPKALPID